MFSSRRTSMHNTQPRRNFLLSDRRFEKKVLIFFKYMDSRDSQNIKQILLIEMI